MRLFIDPVEQQFGRDTKVLIRTDDLVNLCYLQARKDTINALLCGLLMNLETEGGVKQYRQLIAHTEQLQNVNYREFNPKKQDTFFRLLHALYAFLNRDESSVLWLFCISDFKDLATLATKLRDVNDPLSRYLRE